ncbi:alpha/beta fold hydrolase [Acholeplasma equirhinis]|uniref:alpha/beta fold hydrolase n=1 Tax=Acholeplasma equirhinis TaxID=555393 RepID=UPI00197AC2DE|nr:alpha/beta fold hydrolase [Acholeplasma equirhinis]MBN3490233.1 alpha/beta fold hydrolase [Acholeplasma equirhinis]
MPFLASDIILLNSTLRLVSVHIIDHLKFIYPYNAKIILLGHSKGGLVGVEYASRYTNKVAGLISIATPYNYQIFLNGISGDGTLMWPWKMLEIRDQWNQLNIKPKAFALASGAFVARTIPVYYMGHLYNHPVEWSDPYVELSHAMAKGYNNIKAYQIAYQGNIAYEHSGMVDQLFTYHRVLACINQIESE